MHSEEIIAITDIFKGFINNFDYYHNEYSKEHNCLKKFKPFDDEVLAKKPEPLRISLRKHTEDLLNKFSRIADYKFSQKKIEKLKPVDVFTILLCIMCHDIGKFDILWQRMIKEMNLSKIKYPELRHEMNIPYILYLVNIFVFCIKNLKIKESYKNIIDEIDINVILVTIMSHHSKMSLYHKERLNYCKSYLKDNHNKYKKLLPKKFITHYEGIMNFGIDDYFSNYFNSMNEDNYYKKIHEVCISLYFLMKSDHESSRFENVTQTYLTTDIEPPHFDYQTEFKLDIPRTFNINNFQQLVLNYVEKNPDLDVYFLRGGTGIGKSLAASFLAEHLIKKNKNDRMIILLPTKFTSSIIYQEFKNYTETGIKHSSSFMKFIINKNLPKEEIRKILEDLENNRLSDIYDRVLTITTVDNFLRHFSMSKNNSKLAISNVLSANIVIDETDYYCDTIIENLIVTMNIVGEFKKVGLATTTFTIMSATMISKLMNHFKKSISNLKYSELVELKEEKKAETFKVLKPFKDNIFLDIIDNNYDILKPLLSKYIKNNTPIIFYFNTVERAKSISIWINRTYGYNNIICYHSEMVNEDREKKETAIINLLGKKRWEKFYKKESSKPFGFVIMTQVGELSINISGALIISELSPWQLLIQRLGRLERFLRLFKDLKSDPAAGLIIIRFKETLKNGTQKIINYIYKDDVKEHKERKPKLIAGFDITNEFLEKGVIESKIPKEFTKRDIQLLKKAYKNIVSSKKLKVEENDIILEYLYSNFDTTQDAKNNAKNLMTLFKNNIIVQPNLSEFEDIEDIVNISDWRTRSTVDNKVQIHFFEEDFNSIFENINNDYYIVKNIDNKTKFRELLEQRGYKLSWFKFRKLEDAGYIKKIKCTYKLDTEKKFDMNILTNKEVYYKSLLNFQD